MILLLGFGAVALLVWLDIDRVTTRIAAEADVYQDVLSFDRDKIPLTSVGRRAHMWLYASDLIKERPWLGWGIGSSHSLLDRDADLERHPHFHNTYIQILVEQGIVGLTFYGAAIGLLLAGFVQAYQTGRLPFATMLLLSGCWTSVLVWSLAGTRIVHADEHFVLLLLGAITLSYSLGGRKDQ